MRPLCCRLPSTIVLRHKDNYLRAYTVAVAALALDVPVKWLDNVLSHHRISGLETGKQGLQRRIPTETLVVLAIARTLHRGIGAPLAKALDLAAMATNSPGGRVPISSDEPAQAGDLWLGVDVDSVRRALDIRLREAVEFGATPRRGRPPKRVV